MCENFIKIKVKNVFSNENEREHVNKWLHSQNRLASSV